MDNEVPTRDPGCAKPLDFDQSLADFRRPMAAPQRQGLVPGGRGAISAPGATSHGAISTPGASWSVTPETLSFDSVLATGSVLGNSKVLKILNTGSQSLSFEVSSPSEVICTPSHGTVASLAAFSISVRLNGSGG